MRTYKITEAKTKSIIENGEQLIEVRFDVFKGDEKVGEYRLGFPLTTTADTIAFELTNYCATLDKDEATSKKNDEATKDIQTANETISNLLNNNYVENNKKSSTKSKV